MKSTHKTCEFLEELLKHYKDINYNTLVRARIGKLYTVLVKSEEFNVMVDNTDNVEPFLHILNKNLYEMDLRLNSSEAKSIIIPIVREYKLSLLIDKKRI